MKTYIQKNAVYCCIIVLLLMASVSLAQEVYTYVDEEGTVRFTDMPREGWRRVKLVDGDVVEPKTRGALTVAYVSENVRYSALINKAARDYGLDGNLISAVIKVESSGNPDAVSKADAKGLMQLIDDTAAMYGVTNVFNPAQNINAGSRHLRNLLDAYGGDLKLALAAYNAGQGAVARHGGVPPYAETRRYIQKIAALYGDVQSSISDAELATSYVAARALANGQRYIYSYDTRNGYAVSEVVPNGRSYQKIDLFK